MNALIGFCLDESSSMNAETTRDAFNAFLRLQQYRIDDCSLFLVKFGDYYEPTVEFQSIFTVPQMSIPRDRSQNDQTHVKQRSHGFAYDTELHYAPYGGTLLYDSIAYTIQEMQKHIASLPVEERPTRVTLVVQTDGGNTRSANNTSDIKRKVEKAMADGWDVVFLADGNDGHGTASYGAIACGFPSHTIIRYTDPEAAFEKLGEAILDSVVTGKLDLGRNE